MQNTLKIDMDWKPPDNYVSSWLALVDWVVFQYTNSSCKVDMKESQSKRGLHFYIRLKREVQDETALVMQFILGDDRTRCRLNLERQKAGIKNWNKLFVRKIGRQGLEQGPDGRFRRIDSVKNVKVLEDP